VDSAYPSSSTYSSGSIILERLVDGAWVVGGDVGADVLSGSGGDGVRDFCFGEDILATHAEEKSSER